MHRWLNEVIIDGCLETGEVTTKKPFRLPGRIRTHDLRNTCRIFSVVHSPVSKRSSLKQQRTCSCERRFSCLAAVGFQSTPLQK